MPIYTESPGVNDKEYDLNDQDWHPVGPAFEVVKMRDETSLELEYSGECLATSIDGDGIVFQIRIDNTVPNYGSLGSLKQENHQSAIFTKSVYVELVAGRYTAQMYTQVPGLSAQGVCLDPGGWGAKILVTEI